MTTLNTGASPEVANSLQVGDCTINYHDRGQGEPILLIHGSGPGVTAWANWRGVIPALAEKARVIAPDMLGFGYTRCPMDRPLDPQAWVAQLVGLLDALDIPRVAVVGNSFGGAIALAFALRHPERVSRLVLMGSAGLSFQLTEGLDKVWGYQPSLQAMRELMQVFAWDHGIITDDLVRMRYEASIRDDVQSRFAQLFPRQDVPASADGFLVHAGFSSRAAHRKSMSSRVKSAAFSICTQWPHSPNTCSWA